MEHRSNPSRKVHAVLGTQVPQAPGAGPGAFGRRVGLPAAAVPEVSGVEATPTSWTRPLLHFEYPGEYLPALRRVGGSLAARARQWKSESALPGQADRVSVTYFGDGAASEGDSITALNLAAVYGAPGLRCGVRREQELKNSPRE